MSEASYGSTEGLLPENGSRELVLVQISKCVLGQSRTESQQMRVENIAKKDKEALLALSGTFGV